MEVEQLVQCLYSDKDYTDFICESSMLFARGLISLPEYMARIKAVENQIRRQ